jgi:hypothetical protein
MGRRKTAGDALAFGLSVYGELLTYNWLEFMHAQLYSSMLE